MNPVADFATPPDCAVDPCGTVSGTITDSVSGAPLSGVHVGIAGHMSGLGSDLADVTDASGRVRVEDVPFHTYSKFVVDQTGYEQATIANLTVDGDETVDRAITRDWAATRGRRDAREGVAAGLHRLRLRPERRVRPVARHRMGLGLAGTTPRRREAAAERRHHELRVRSGQHVR